MAGIVTPLINTPANEQIVDIGLINSSHENEEDKEDVEDEVHRSEKGVGVFDGGKVEVAEDEAELGEAGVRDGVKVLDLGAEHEEGKLRKGHEDDAEHDGEGPDVRRAGAQFNRNFFGLSYSLRNHLSFWLQIPYT